MSVDHMCRTCLKTGMTMFPLFNEDPNAENFVVEVLQLLLQNSIYPDDDASHYICLECLGKVRETNEFIEQCRHSDTSFRLMNEKTEKLIEAEESSHGLQISNETAADVLEPKVELDDAQENVSEICDLTKDDEEDDDDFSEEEVLTEAEEPTDEILECPACLDAFGMVSVLRMHLIEVHSMDSQCIMCNNEYFDDIWSHTKFHIPKNRCCIVCGKKFITIESLEKHMKMNPCLDGIFSCDLCSRGFHNEEAYRDHVSSKHSFVCDICYESFYSQIELDGHKTIHSQLEEFICGVCGQDFKKRDLFEAHLGSHSEEIPLDVDDQAATIHQNGYAEEVFEVSEILEVPCDEEQSSDVQFADDFEVSSHSGDSVKRKRFKEMASTVFRCDVCYKTFRDNTRLNDHRTVHTGEKPFECQICGKRFRVKRNLRAHVVSHSSITPFMCTFCGLQYKKKFVLMGHLQEKHGTEKYFPCCYCETKAVTIKDLSIHYRYSHPTYYSDIANRI